MAATQGNGAVDATASTRYVAWGAVVAAVVILPNALLAVWFFPVGAALVSGLGVALSVAGLSSPWQRSSALLLLVHLAILCWTFLQNI